MREGIDQRLPEPLRTRAVEHLRRELHPDTLDVLRKRYESDPEPWGGYFHFGAGMAIRNLLREAIRDDELPPVEYYDGRSYSNWDDYYIDALEGALDVPTAHEEPPEVPWYDAPRRTFRRLREMGVLPWVEDGRWRDSETLWRVEDERVVLEIEEEA